MKAILLFEDNPGVQVAIIRTLRRLIPEVAIFAFEKAESIKDVHLEQSPLFIWTDYKLAGEETGADVIRYSLIHYPDTPIILCSGSHTFEHEQVTVLPKPAPASHIKKAIDTIIS